MSLHDLNDFALSTMWMQHRYERVADFAAAARGLGFAGIETSHIVTPAMLGDADVRSLGIRSVHFILRNGHHGSPASPEFCPHPGLEFAGALCIRGHGKGG